MSDLPHTQDLPSASQSNPCTDDREPISEVSSNSETSASTSECDSLSNALHSDDDDDDGTDTTITTPTTHEPDTQESKILLHRPTPAQNSVSSNPAGKPSYSDRITASKTASEGLHRRGRSAQITHPEDGWDADSPTKGLVLQHGTKDGLPTVERQLLYTSPVMNAAVQPAPSGRWMFTRTFTEDNFMAAGRLHIPAGGSKPIKSVNDNAYVFYVVEGAVSVRVHDTQFIVSPDGTFMVPRGNTYHIENISSRTSKLVFFQARQVHASEDPLSMPGHSTLPMPPNKVNIIIGWLTERLLKRATKYRKVLAEWYIRTSFAVGRRLNGPQSYWLYFLVGFMLRGLLRLPGNLRRINVQFIRNAHS